MPLRMRGDGTPITAPVCPHCGATITAQAIVPAFMDRPAWEFWGKLGERWRRCHEMATLPDGRMVRYVHFRVIANRRKVDRLAWIAGEQEDK